MRWSRFFVVSLAMLALPMSAYAAQTADIQVTVTIRYLSVSVSPASYAFGIVDAGSYTIANSAIVVENDGNDTEDFRLQVTGNTGPWTVLELAGAPGNEEYKLMGLFNANQPIAGNYTDNADAIYSSGTKDCGSTYFSGTQDGDDVAALGTVNLWLRFGAPGTTAVRTMQTITVQVTACKADTF